MVPLIEEFEAYLAFEQRLSPLSLKAYLGDMRIFLAFLKKNSILPWNLTTDIYEKFLAMQSKNNLKNATLSRRFAALNAFAKFIAKKNLQPQVTFALISKSKKSKKLPCFLSVTTINSILATFFENAPDTLQPKAHRDRMIILFLYTLGLRATELVNVKISDFSKDLSTLRILGKGGKERILPMPSFLQEQLLNYLETGRSAQLNKGSSFFLSPYLFLGNKARPLSRISIFNLIKKFAKEYNLPETLSPHKLRHSIATHLLAKGANLRMIQSFLGHSSISTVQIYTHLDLSKLRSEYDKYHPRA